MKTIKLKPRSPGTRHAIKLNKSLLLKSGGNLFKNSINYQRKFVGRSSLTGHITVRGKQLGCKKKYRRVDFQNKSTVGVVIAVSYDPNRTAFISLVFDFKKKSFFTTLAPDFLFTGFIYSCNKKIKYLKFGYRTELLGIPAGSLINNISINKDSFSKYARSAGTSCQILQKTNFVSKIRLPSGKILDISNNIFATLGIMSNTKNKLICLGKAGKNRLKGRRPIVRGIAMNPVDHPHGGRANSGFVYVTPWGRPTKGVKTRKKNE